MITNLFCLARDEVRAMRVLDDLRGHHFPEDGISVLVPERALVGGFGSTLAPGAERSADPAQDGQTAGPIVLCGMAHLTSLTRPTLGRLMGAGPFMLRLNAPSAGREPASFVDELANAGIPLGRAEAYQRQLAAGKILISVTAMDLEESVRLQTLLAAAGAEDLTVLAETSSDDRDGGLLHYGRAA